LLLRLIKMIRQPIDNRFLSPNIESYNTYYVN